MKRETLAAQAYKDSLNPGSLSPLQKRNTLRILKADRKRVTKPGHQALLDKAIQRLS